MKSLNETETAGPRSALGGNSHALFTLHRACRAAIARR
jgi:hypothetical protein